MSVSLYIHVYSYMCTCPSFQTRSIQKDRDENEEKPSSGFKDSFGKTPIPVLYIALLRIEAIHKCLKAPEKQAAKKACAVRDKQSNLQLTYCMRNQKARVKGCQKPKHELSIL